MLDLNSHSCTYGTHLHWWKFVSQFNPLVPGSTTCVSMASSLQFVIWLIQIRKTVSLYLSHIRLLIIRHVECSSSQLNWLKAWKFDTNLLLLWAEPWAHRARLMSVVTKEINNDELIAHCLPQQIRNLLVTVTLAKENYSSFHSMN